MSNKPILYSMNISHPARVIKIVSKLIGVELDVKDLDLLKGENFQPWFLKLNPEHTVPTLVDTDGFVVWESHAIATYLIDKYAKDDKLYPKDLQTRALVNQRLFFENSMYVRLRDCSYHVLRYGGTGFPPEKTDPIYAAYEVLEAFLEAEPFLVGDALTVADISVACSVSAFTAIFAPLSPEKHPKILAWLKRVEETVQFFQEMNSKYVDEYYQLIYSTIEKNKTKN